MERQRWMFRSWGDAVESGGWVLESGQGNEWMESQNWTLESGGMDSVKWTEEGWEIDSGEWEKEGLYFLSLLRY